MSVQHAILGLLSWKPATGYELKKTFEASDFMHWSGNSNQIYKPLLLLQQQGLADCETIHQDGAPSKKVYHITEAGREALLNWVRSAPEPMEIRKTFLIQLSWADGLSDTELDALLLSYEEEVLTQLTMQRENNRRGTMAPNRTKRETLLWEAIHENMLSAWQQELSWVRELRWRLQERSQS